MILYFVLLALFFKASTNVVSFRQIIVSIAHSTKLCFLIHHKKKIFTKNDRLIFVERKDGWWKVTSFRERGSGKSDRRWRRGMKTPNSSDVICKRSQTIYSSFCDTCHVTAIICLYLRKYMPLRSSPLQILYFFPTCITPLPAQHWTALPATVPC